MDLTQLVRQTCQEVGMPALGAIILRQDEIVNQAITGVRRLGTETAVTPDDHFHIGSNAKAMTGTIAAMLVEAGRLCWDATMPL